MNRRGYYFVVMPDYEAEAFLVGPFVDEASRDWELERAPESHTLYRSLELSDADAERIRADLAAGRYV